MFFFFFPVFYDDRYHFFQRRDVYLKHLETLHRYKFVARFSVRITTLGFSLFVRFAVVILGFRLYKRDLL